MMGFNHDQNPYRAMHPTPETDGILYGLAIEEQLLATPVAPSPATTLADAATPELTSPDLPATASAQSARSASFSFATPTATSSGSFSVAPSARSASFCLPSALGGSGSSPSLAELFLRGPSAEQNALQNYLNNLATNNTSVGGEAAGGSKRKRKHEDKDKKKRKRRSEERTKKTAERTKTTAQRTKTTTSVSSVPETASVYGTTTETVRPQHPVAPMAQSGFMQSPPVASSPVPYSSPSAYFASPCLSPSLSSSASSFSTYPPTPFQPTTPASPYPNTGVSTTSACDFYPNVLFDGAPSPVTSLPALATWSQPPFYGRYAQPPMQRQQYYAPQKEDVDFWLDVEASLPSIQSAALQAQQQHRDFFNTSFTELEQLLFEHDL